MIFLGLLFPKTDEELIRAKSKSGSVQNQANQFQWSLIEGLHDNCQETQIINCLPVGTFPNEYADIILHTKEWFHQREMHIQIGSINLPILKQISRTLKIRKELKAHPGENIIIYSPYLPFLRAVKKLNESHFITLIVTDLPEYYDLGKVSFPRRFHRTINNMFIYKCLDRVDAYVLLTEAMQDRLPIGNKPHVVIEGIYSGTSNHSLPTSPSNKKIVFYAGTLHRAYGIQILLEAFSLIEDENTELWICGSGEAESDIKKSARRDRRICFYGFCSSAQVQELQSRATVLVNPRTDEGEYTKYSFPSKTMNYMASGIPVVMFRLHGIPTEYDDYLNYVEQNNAQALASLLAEICNDRSGLYTSKANKARHFILTKKNASIQASKILAMIEQR